MNDAKSAAAKRAEERQQSYKRALKEREEFVRKERAHTRKLRELRLAKEAEEKGKAWLRPWGQRPFKFQECFS